jgi:hypothetical protein
VNCSSCTGHPELRKVRGALQNLARKSKQAENEAIYGSCPHGSPQKGMAMPHSLNASSSKKRTSRDLLNASTRHHQRGCAQEHLRLGAEDLMFRTRLAALAAEPTGAGPATGPVSKSTTSILRANRRRRSETLAAMKPSESGNVPRIVSERSPTQTSRQLRALRFTGNIRIPASGKYSFFVASDDGSRITHVLLLHDQLLNDRLQRDDRTRSQCRF